MYKFRRMSISDYNEVINLWKNTDGIGLSGNDESKKSIKKFLRHNPKTCFVATIDDEEIIGTIMAGDDGRRGNIYHLMVKHEHRKNGIGKDLLERAEKALKKDGVRKIFLVVFKSNEVGNKFWKKNGYDLRDDLNYLNKVIDD
ncbi:MAG: GNAT family N-acetyltransferase [Treponema sp.]|nr:GNAT family N-acetyltransferase [Treponema sp.]